MGKKFNRWHARSSASPRSAQSLKEVIFNNRKFNAISKLEYGDYGLESAKITILEALKNNQRIALYADYDVDGTMSCVSWIWFFKAIGFTNYTYYIPCRFKEGYGLNLDAIKHLIHNEKAQLIITMDTGITANIEAEYCKQNNVKFICTDHHVVQPEKMPDCTILNPKFHPDPLYQQLCGCGITFVLLRQLGKEFSIEHHVWSDLLALSSIATICDLVPLNGVNHQIARMGVQALLKSTNPVLMALKKACSLENNLDEKDVGFRVGPRINAVGRLEHAELIIQAFLEENYEPLISKMGELNEERKIIQKKIVDQALEMAQEFEDDPILFLGNTNWHPGVVGIAASKIAETFWRPTWIFQYGESVCKGSARAIPGFDVTAAMQSAAPLWTKFGGHQAAGGFSFETDNLDLIREQLNEYALEIYSEKPEMWESCINYDCQLPVELLDLATLDALEDLKPFGMGFEQPKFMIRAPIVNVEFYLDKQTGQPKHTACEVGMPGGKRQKIMYFNEVHHELQKANYGKFIVNMEKNNFRGQTSLNLFGLDYAVE